MGLGEALILLDLCLVFIALALVLNVKTEKWPWGRLSVDGRTGQSGAPPDTVRCASHVTQPLGFDCWSSDRWGHRTVRWCTRQYCSLSGAPSGACSDSARTVRAL
jgi:hypothetical protein